MMLLRLDAIGHRKAETGFWIEHSGNSWYSDHTGTDVGFRNNKDTVRALRPRREACNITVTKSVTLHLRGRCSHSNLFQQ